MIKRLVEEEGLDPVDRQLADLFRAATPFAADPFRSRRVWVRLERASTRRATASRWLRPVAVVTLLISGSAAAAIGHRYAGTPDVAAATASLAPVEEPAARSIQKPMFDRRLASASESPVPPAAPEASAQPEPASSAVSRVAHGQTRVETSEDATKVVEAIQALRTESNPARARALLNDYLKTNPRGVLSGDALALSIEAASAQHDPKAAEYARRYLSAYPKGKYRELAKRALEAQR